MNFNSILIGTDDAARLIEYYSRLFGAPQMADETYAGWVIGGGFVGVGPHSEVTGKSLQPGRIIWNIESADVQGDFERLKAAGGIVIKDPYVFQAEVGRADHRHVRGSRRQLLPAHEPDDAVGATRVAPGRLRHVAVAAQGFRIQPRVPHPAQGSAACRFCG